MKWMKQHWRGITPLLAAILISVGGFSGYWWFHKLAPSRRTLNPRWCASHSQREYWRELQKSIHRAGWFHDDGFAVGGYGDEQWMEWIIDHIEPIFSVWSLA